MDTNKYKLSFHHFGLAVKNPRKALQFLKGLGYEVRRELRDDLQNVNVIDCVNKDQPDVELVYPTETAGPLDVILEKGSNWVYHLCYKSPDVKKSLQAIKADGLRFQEISSPRPAVLFGGQKVSFYYVAGYGLIEILECS